MWIQSFFLFSIIWAFGSILKVNVRKEFDRQLRGKILCNTEEISTIAQLKNKIVNKQDPAKSIPGKQGNEAKNVFEPTTEFKETEKPPYFLSPIPPSYTLFEVYFDLETN